MSKGVKKVEQNKKYIQILFFKIFCLFFKIFCLFFKILFL
jgi:hypothetical protein